MDQNWKLLELTLLIQFFLVGSINIFDYFGATQIEKKVLDAAHVGAQLLMSYISPRELYLSVPTTYLRCSSTYVI